METPELATEVVLLPVWFNERVDWGQTTTL